MRRRARAVVVRAVVVRAVVVTDLREPLAAVHRRMIRTRTVLMVVWILGWAATGFVYRTAWLALLILAVTGPVLWLAVWWNERRIAPGRRLPVGAPGAEDRDRGITGPAAPGAGAGR